MIHDFQSSWVLLQQNKYMETPIQKKHIDVVVKYFYPVAAGIETNIMETYSVLAKRGFDVTIHTSVDTLTKKNHLSKVEELRGLNIKRYSWHWWGFWPAINFKTTEVVALHNSNIFPHLTIMVYSLYRKLRGNKTYALILTPHGGYNPEWSIFPAWQAFIKKAIQYSIVTFFINRSVDGVRAVSEWERIEMGKKGIKPEKIITIDNGLEDEAYMDLELLASKEVKEKVAAFGEYIIQVGRVYVIKNYETTIRALPHIPSHIKFVIVGPIGDEKYLESLRNLIASLNLTDRVIFYGVIRGVDKYYLIKHAKMMVHMALWESFCNVVHEGLSQGLVCIVANNTALPLLIKDGVTGYCIETKDSNAVAEKINYVLEHFNETVIQEIQKKSREFGLKNSWAEVAEKMKSFYISKVAIL